MLMKLTTAEQKKSENAVKQSLVGDWLGELVNFLSLHAEYIFLAPRAHFHSISILKLDFT